ncbi:hypothetical protein [Endozoicomonas numazuensis]|uniref:hypothetical protein n=1 Tax=Endozoicomonas numazuensis TaxID=1137799 RepID=UPI000A6FB1BF|nr:hypothetical protein [Endozoicomonas numazuensis]
MTGMPLVYDVASDGTLSNLRIYRDDKAYELIAVVVTGAVVSVVIGRVCWALHRIRQAQ